VRGGEGEREGKTSDRICNSRLLCISDFGERKKKRKKTAVKKIKKGKEGRQSHFMDRNLLGCFPIGGGGKGTFGERTFHEREGGERGGERKNREEILYFSTLDSRI